MPGDDQACTGEGFKVLNVTVQALLMAHADILEICIVVVCMLQNLMA